MKYTIATVALLLLVVGCKSEGDKQQDAAQSQRKQIYTAAIEVAKGQLKSPEAAHFTILESVNTDSASIAMEGNDRAVVTAKYLAEVSGGNHSTEKFKIYLVNANGKWLVDTSEYQPVNMEYSTVSPVMMGGQASDSAK